jgi:putative oxidoreductase
LTDNIDLITLAVMNSLNRFADPFYCIMRLVVGLMFACHGLDKIFGTFTPNAEALPTLMAVGGWLEIVCGFLIAFGLLTRLAAFVASGEMAVAFFMMHAPRGLIPYVNKGELAVVYCFVFFYIFLRGSGSLSIDALWCKGRAGATTATTP